MTTHKDLFLIMKRKKDNYGYKYYIKEGAFLSHSAFRTRKELKIYLEKTNLKIGELEAQWKAYRRYKLKGKIEIFPPALSNEIPEEAKSIKLLFNGADRIAKKINLENGGSKIYITK